MKKLLWIVGLMAALHVGVCAQVNMKQVERAVQYASDKQDAQIHDLYTQSYLKEMQKKDKKLLIVRSEKDWKKLTLLGDSYRFQKAEELAQKGPSNFVNNYVNPRATQSISVWKLGVKETVAEVLADIKNLSEGTGFVLQTYDLFRADEGIISFTKTQKDGTVKYMVFRVFEKTKGNVFFARVTRTLGSYNVEIMRSIFQALKQTPSATLTEHFVAQTCQMGVDCY